MSFRFIFSNTTRPAPFYCGDTGVQGSAKVWRMRAMIAQADLDIELGQFTRNALILCFNRE